MRVFLTGATGFIGSRIVQELIGAGHQVVGLTRSEAGRRALEQAGADAHMGELEKPESLADGAAQADAVIHTAFDHDFTNFAANCEKDSRVIKAIGMALAGTDRRFLITSGVGMGAASPGAVATENAFDRNSHTPRVLSELAGADLAERGVSVAVVRLPQVHDTAKHGLASPLIELAQAKGISGYVGSGSNRWSAAHVADVARLFRLALEKHEQGARWHAVAEEGVSMRNIAEAIGVRLGVPVLSVSPDMAEAHFGHLLPFATADWPASSVWTRERLGWQPTGPGILADLQHRDDSSNAAEPPAAAADLRQIQASDA